jgi:hypothetical protein
LRDSDITFTPTKTGTATTCRVQEKLQFIIIHAGILVYRNCPLPNNRKYPSQTKKPKNQNRNSGNLQKQNQSFSSKTAAKPLWPSPPPSTLFLDSFSVFSFSTDTFLTRCLQDTDIFPSRDPTTDMVVMDA